MAVTPEAIKYVAVIYKPSLFVAVTPEAIKYVAVIYKPSLTCRHLQADHSGTPLIYPPSKLIFIFTNLAPLNLFS